MNSSRLTQSIRAILFLCAAILALVPVIASGEAGNYPYPLDPKDYDWPVYDQPLGQAQSEPVDARFFNDAVFIGDSVTVKLQLYATDRRNNGEECLGRAKFLCSTSLGAGNALWDVSEKSVHPTFLGEKMRVEKAVELLDAHKVIIMLGMNDVGAYGVDGAVEKFEQLVDLILEKQPDAVIFVQSVTPRVSTSTATPTTRQLFDYDIKLYNLCVERGWRYIDVAWAIRDEYGFLPAKYCSDVSSMGLHFNDAGCEIWVDYLMTHLGS